MRVDGTGAALLLVVFALVPWLAFRSRRLLAAIAGGEVPVARALFFWQTTLFQLFLYALALVAASRDAIYVRLVPRHWLPAWPAAALLLLAVLVLQATWRFRSQSDRALLGAILPRTRADLLPYLVLCVTAGVGEEVVYRGVAYRLMLRLGCTATVAIVALAAAFALGHALQGWRSALAIFVFALGFHAVVLYANALLPAILAHVSYDIYAGLIIPRWQREKPA